MIVEQALTIAGPSSVLAARPTGVAHVYTGPLTPSQRFIPRAARVVCRARTRRLWVVDVPSCWSSLSPKGGVPRLCARCSACLARRRGPIPSSASSPTGQAEQHPRTRDEHLAVFAGVTPADLYVAAHLAADVDELAAVGHLSLLLFGHTNCTRPTVLPSGRTKAPLHHVITRRRAETPHPDITARAHAAEAQAEHAARIRADRAQELKAARDRRRAPRLNPTGAPL